MIGACSPNVVHAVLSVSHTIVTYKTLSLKCTKRISLMLNKEIHFYYVQKLHWIRLKCVLRQNYYIYIHMYFIIYKENKNLKHYSLLPFLVHTFCVSNALIFLCRLLSSFNVSLQWFKSHGSISLKSLITFIDSDFINGCQCDLAFCCNAGKIFGSICFRF